MSDKTGKDMETLLSLCRITTNKNTVPGEKRKPTVASGVRVGTPAVTTRGMTEGDMEKIASFIARVLEGGEAACPGVEQDVVELMKRFPLYESFPND
jgi:glycine hydroxymethyltransferase